MNRSIWKFALDPKYLTIAMPRGAVVLCAHEQCDMVFVWVEVDTTAPLVARTFEVYGTGHAIPATGERKYIGTALLHNGSLVFHVYEQVNG